MADRVARRFAAAGPADRLARIVSAHWGGPWKVTFDDNLVNVMLKDPEPGGATVMEVGGQETMSGQRRRKMLRAMRDAARKIEREAKRQFKLDDVESGADSVFMVSDDFIGVSMRVLKSRGG